MYTVTTYDAPALVAAELVGRFNADDVQRLSSDLDHRLLAQAPPAVLMLDITKFEPAGDHVTALLDIFVARSLDAGVRVARVVGSEIVAHQLDRVAREADLHDRIKHFWERDPALSWLKGTA